MNALLAAVVAASSDAIVSYAMDATILTWNPAAERMFGYAAAEVIGAPMACIVPPECVDEPDVLFTRVRAGETIRDLETMRLRKAGCRFPVLVNLAPIRDDNGVIVGVSSTVCDLSGRRRAEGRFRGLLDAAPDPILGVDREGRIIFANARADQVFGYSPMELIGQSIEVLVPATLRAEHVRLRESYHRAPTTRPMGIGLDLWALRRDGTMFPVEISLSPMADVDGPLFVAIVRDTSERKRAEEERTRERAEVERLKDDLSSMIVHDLKNPVNGIAMTVQAMLRRGEEVSERQRKSLGNIEQTCREMLRLVQNLLEIAKMETGKMPVAREAVDLAELADQVRREYGPVAEQVGKRLAIAVGGDLPYVVGDMALVKRVLVNLVVNAIRHSGAQEVRIEGAAPLGAPEVTIQVVDDGCGVPPEDRERIFEKFASLRRSPAGDPSPDTGLGLPFCKLAVEHMGGRIGLTSTPGASTVFAVTLPMHTPPRPR